MINSLRARLRPKEQGQALVIVALFLSLVFLVFAALAIDGTILYLRRRQLQNIADAAALATAIQLSQNKNVPAAYTTAMNSIATNEGRIEWYSTSATPNPPATNTGTGVDLHLGIEITDACDVRVALYWNDIGTYFTQFFGRQQLEAEAKAHAGCNRSGGLQPIAVKRFGDEVDWNPDLQNINSATVYCDDCNSQQSLDGPPAQGLTNATDFLRPATADEIQEWPGWPDGSVLFQSPSPHADLAAGAPGRDYFFLGGGVRPSVGTTSYAGLVNLDIRHVSAPPVEYYNGVDAGTNSNTLKNLGEYYIRYGYCCDIPWPGDQVAMYNGNSTAFAAQAFQDTYRVGDVVAVIVYDGHVHHKPDLVVTGETPYYKITHPTTDTVTNLAYNINLEGDNGFNSSTSGLTLGVEGLAGFADYSFSPTTSPVLPWGGLSQRTITLFVTPTLTTTFATTITHVVTGTRAFYVSVIDNKTGGTGIRRYWAGVLSVGDTVSGTPRDLPAVTGFPEAGQNYPFASVIKGDPATIYKINLDVWGVTSDRSVTVSGPATLPTGFSFQGTLPSTENVRWDRHPGASFNMKIRVDNTATASATPYVIPLTVAAAGMAPQTFKLYVLVVDAQPPIDDYVQILGYAALEVRGFYNSTNNLIDPNDPSPPPANAVRGRIVSRLMTDPSDLTYGLRARLIPWEQ